MQCELISVPNIICMYVYFIGIRTWGACGAIFIQIVRMNDRLRTEQVELLCTPIFPSPHRHHPYIYIIFFDSFMSQ